MRIISIKKLLTSWFSYPQNKIYCQVSTISEGSPRVRSMALYHITEDGQLIFFTDTSTKKWKELQKISKTSICILHANYGQIIVEGEAILTNSLSDPAVTKFYWDNFLDEYWKNFYKSQCDQSKQILPAAFGIIAVVPYRWEILEIDQVDFLKSVRKEFVFKRGSWAENSLIVS